MSESISFEQMKGALGSLLILWARIESALKDEVVRAHDGQLPKSAHGIAAVLRTWEATVGEGPAVSPFRSLLAASLRGQLTEALEIRNGVCHGLVGVAASHGDQPASLRWELNDTKRSVTWGELQPLFRWLSKLPSAISMISESSSEELGSRMIDRPENREWWKTEYGIDLPGADARSVP